MSWWCHSDPIQWYCECEKCSKHHPAVGINSRTIWLDVNDLLSPPGHLEITPDPLGYCGKGPKGVGCSPDSLKCDFGWENCWKQEQNYNICILIIYKTRARWLSECPTHRALCFLDILSSWLRIEIWKLKFFHFFKDFPIFFLSRIRR